VKQEPELGVDVDRGAVVGNAGADAADADLVNITPFFDKLCMPWLGEQAFWSVRRPS